MAARVAAEAGTASFPVGLVARADAVTAAEDRFFGGTAGLGFGGGGPHTSGSASSAESPKARAITSLDGVGGRPIATASSCARLTSISCSQGMSRPLKAGTAGGSGPGTGAAGSRFSLVGWRPEETGAGAGTGAAGSPLAALAGDGGEVLRGRVGPARGRRAPATTPGLRRRRRGEGGGRSRVPERGAPPRWRGPARARFSRSCRAMRSRSSALTARGLDHFLAPSASAAKRHLRPSCHTGA